MTLEIIFSNERIAAVKLEGELYYLRLDIHLPEVYDRQCNKLTISNINTWINNKTRQQYDYFQIIELCLTFHKGYTSNIINIDSDNFITSFIKRIIKTLFTSGLASKYVNDYWIECTCPTKFSTKIISPIMKKHELLMKKLGKNIFEDYANRIRLTATAESANSVNKMFDRLKLEAREPVYPDTSELDDLFINNIKHDLIISTIPEEISKGMLECSKKFL